MATFTTNKNLENPATGELVNSWGPVVDSNMTILDGALGGVTSIVLPGSFGATNTFTTAQYQNLVLAFSGTITSNFEFDFPSGVGGFWIINNATTGSFTVTLGTVGVGSPKAVCPQGFTAIVYSNGSGVVFADGQYAPLASPALTGTPTAPTPSPGTNSTRIATTAFVAASFAPLASPALTGTPTAPTQSTGDNTTAVATDAFVNASIAAQGAVAPTGRLTLTSGVPVLSGAVSAATSMIYTPYVGSQIPVWNGSKWAPTPFTEISQALSDATHSPAAAVANSLYDLFVWSNSGTITLSRGPVWTNATTRSLTLTSVNGVLTNTSSITNGPAAGFGVYVGTVATDTSAATVTFNPQPAAASGGPSGGAWVGLWNYYNRTSVATSAQDSKASWTTASTTFNASDASNNNRITFVTGQALDALSAIFNITAFGASGAGPFTGIGLNSTSSPQIVAGTNSASTTFPLTVAYAGAPVLGQNYLQALQAASGSATVTYYGTSASLAATTVQLMQLSAQLNY